MKTIKVKGPARRRVVIERWVTCSVRWFFNDGTSKYTRYTTTKLAGVTFDEMVENQLKFLREDVRNDSRLTGARLISVDGVRVNRTA